MAERETAWCDVCDHSCAQTDCRCYESHRWAMEARAERETCVACQHPEHVSGVCGVPISNQGYVGPCRCGAPTREQEIRALLGLGKRRRD